MTICGFLVLIIALTAFIAVSGITTQIKDEIATMGVFQLFMLIVASVLAVITFIACLWILYGLGFY